MELMAKGGRMPRQMPRGVCSLDAKNGLVRFGGLDVEQWGLQKKRYARVWVDDREPGIAWVQFADKSDGHPSWRKVQSIQKSNCRQFCYSELFNRFNPKHGRYEFSRDPSGLFKIYVTQGAVGEMKRGLRKKEGE